MCLRLKPFSLTTWYPFLTWSCAADHPSRANIHRVSRCYRSSCNILGPGHSSDLLVFFLIDFPQISTPSTNQFDGFPEHPPHSSMISRTVPLYFLLTSQPVMFDCWAVCVCVYVYIYTLNKQIQVISGDVTSPEEHTLHHGPPELSKVTAHLIRGNHGEQGGHVLWKQKNIRSTVTCVGWCYGDCQTNVNHINCGKSW